MPVKVIGPAFGAVTTRSPGASVSAHADGRGVAQIEGAGGHALLPCAASAPRVTLSPMAVPPLRTFLPRSLFGRALTILLVPIVALQLVVGLVFFQRHYQRVTEQMTRNVAYELAYAVEEIDAAERAAWRRRGASPSSPARSSSGCGSSRGRRSSPG